jgi:pimeloyl-ACP methyl ester carboxylesterase
MLASIVTPTLVIEGEESPPVMRAAARAVAEAMPNGQLATLRGQVHDIAPTATSTVLIDFL